MTKQPHLEAGRRVFIERGVAAHKRKHPRWSSPCVICGVMYEHSYSRYPKTCGKPECIRGIHLRALEVARTKRRRA